MSVRSERGTFYGSTLWGCSREPVIRNGSVILAARYLRLRGGLLTFVSIDGDVLGTYRRANF
ncbi:MAG: hypothetical protein H0V23_01275 [Nocardioidaceae bacterium]|nr:hypothetical protein [Nocardioidaceae bacterium]